MTPAMMWGLAWHDGIRFAAGILIIAVGMFVLAAKPGSTLHRLFFLLALMDGLSTILFGLAIISRAAFGKAYFVGTYFYFFVAFLALLAIFGILFPKPPRRLARNLLVGGVLGSALLFAIVYVLDHGLFWRLSPSSPFTIAMMPAGNLVNLSFALIIPVLLVRLTRELVRETSESHRRQSAYVLGGMALAYLPYPWTITAQDLAAVGPSVFVEGRWDRILAHWAFAAAALSMLASALLLARRLRPEARDERAFVYACYAGVVALAGLALAVPSEQFGATLRSIALLAYPALLGFAIARYEVFDIDRQLRRAATVSLSAMALTGAFILAEEAASNMLAQSVVGEILGGGTASALVAALATAVIFVPATRVSRRAAAKIVPELAADEIHARKLEIYRHSLAGALADGILREGESRTLAALRSSLGISDHDHQRLLSEVAA